MVGMNPVKSLFTTIMSSGRNMFNPSAYVNTGPAMNVLTGTLNAFPTSAYNGGAGGAGAGGPKYPSITRNLTPTQFQAIQQIHDLYTLVLASRQYDKIPTDYNQYITLLNDLSTININDNILMLLLNIIEKTLVGTMNVVSMYETSMYNELQIILLNNRINDILSNKNSIELIGDKNNISGQISLQKVVKLSRIYSLYINLYGCPDYGVGFDAKKLQFLQKCLGMFDASQIEKEELEKDLALTEPIPIQGQYPEYVHKYVDYKNTALDKSIYEIGYTYNIQHRLDYYEKLYPMGFFMVSAMIDPLYLGEMGVNADPGAPTDASGIASLAALKASLGTVDNMNRALSDSDFKLNEVMQFLTNYLVMRGGVVMDPSFIGLPPHVDLTLADVPTTSKWVYTTEYFIYRAFDYAQYNFGGRVHNYYYDSYHADTATFTVMDTSSMVLHTQAYPGDCRYVFA
jgi:hypothetical protein